MKRKAEKRAAGKMAGEDANENPEAALEKAERLRATVRILISFLTLIGCNRFPAGWQNLHVSH